jgi:hypothetical protein
MPQRFKSTDFPLTETFSFRPHLPCRLEEDSGGAPETADEELSPDFFGCPYAATCDSTAGTIPLRRVYGRSIAVTLVEPVGNIVIRSEQQFNKNERHRMGLRKHIYEVTSGDRNEGRFSESVVKTTIERLRQMNCPKLVELQQEFMGLSKLHCRTTKRGRVKSVSWTILESALSEVVARLHPGNSQKSALTRRTILDAVKKTAYSPMHCFDMTQSMKFGRYLGFVDLRTKSIHSPVAMAVLVPPRHFRHDHKVTMVLGDYGRLFGSHGFPATVYSMHDPESSGAYCGQACAIMAVSMLSDRGATVTGSYDLTLIGKERLANSTNSEDSNCLRTDSDVEYSVEIYGLAPREILRALAHCNTSAELAVANDNATFRKLMGKIIRSYISARCPVILLVHTEVWWQSPSRANGHAVVVVGVQRSADSIPTYEGNMLETSSHLIVHDPGSEPFMRRDEATAMDATCRFASRTLGPGIKAILVADGTVKRHAFNCANYLMNADPIFWDEYFVAPTDRNWGQDGWTDYEVELIHRDDLIKRFALFRHDLAETEIATRSRMAPLSKYESFWFNSLRSLSSEGISTSVTRSWYWCFAAYEVMPVIRHSRPISLGILRAIWLFDASGESNSTWTCKFVCPAETIATVPLRMDD